MVGGRLPYSKPMERAPPPVSDPEPLVFPYSSPQRKLLVKEDAEIFYHGKDRLIYF